MILNNGVHADLVLPINHPSFNWKKYLRDSDFPQVHPEHRYAMFGCGNRHFYMETRTWDDVKILTILRAFSGIGDTVVHVELSNHMAWGPERTRRIRLSPNQFQLLCKHLFETFAKDQHGRLMPISDAHYHQHDAFYEAVGSYHLFRTCNVWAGTGLAKAGVRVGYWTVTPGLLFACLPDDAPEMPKAD